MEPPLCVRRFAWGLPRHAAQLYWRHALSMLWSHAGARIGSGMANKQKQRAAAKEQEAIDSGMMQHHGKGKRKRAQSKVHVDRGLNEAQGFTPGLMKVPRVQSGARPGRSPAGGIAKQKGNPGRGGRRK